jgi:iron(III) transport system substrate-binding protein
MTVTRRHAVALLASAGLICSSASVFAQSVPAGYPAAYADVIAAAKKEAKLTVYTSTDAAQAKGLLDAFKKAYPGIEIDWNDLGTNNSYNRAISEAAAGQVTADLVWTSAMDLLINLVEKGLTAPITTPEDAAIPAWAKYKGQAYGTSVEPAAIIYNKNLFPADAVPKTRADLIKVLQDRKDALKGKVATFDPEKSGMGFLWSTNDSTQTTTFWDLAKAFGATQGKTYSSSGQMREKVVSGEHTIAFNVIGSYAIDWAKKNPAIGVVFQNDYTASFARVVVMTKGAPHPNAARLFVDFMLSKAGQEAAAGSGIPSLPPDVAAGTENIDSLKKLVGGNLKPIPLDGKLIDWLEPKKRSEFLAEWKKAIAN